MSSLDRAVILGAGLGTRLKWLTADKPKALMPIAGVPAIVHVIRRLAAQGIQDIAINVHHHADQLMQELGDGSRYGVRLYYSPEKSLLSSGGGVRTAMEKLPGEGLLLVHNADVLADIDVTELAGHCPDRGCALAMVANPAHHRQGDFVLIKDRLVQEGGTRLTYAGVSVWGDAVLRPMPVSQSYSLVDSMRTLMDQGRCSGMLHHGMWLDIGRPRDWLQASRILARET